MSWSKRHLSSSVNVVDSSISVSAVMEMLLRGLLSSWAIPDVIVPTTASRAPFTRRFCCSCSAASIWLTATARSENSSRYLRAGPMREKSPTAILDVYPSNLRMGFTSALAKQYVIAANNRRRMPTRTRGPVSANRKMAVSYTHLRAHETVLDLVCRLLLEKKK